MGNILPNIEKYFYSRASCEARRISYSCCLLFAVISTHAPRVRRDCNAVWSQVINNISTHAPRVRRDCFFQVGICKVLNFYSRASCEARPGTGYIVDTKDDFYSRASCEARQNHQHRYQLLGNFYSRASCEARRILWELQRLFSDFYSRASCEARRH